MHVRIFAFCLLASCIATTVSAQQPAAPSEEPKLRKLAPWVMKTIPYAPEEEETFSGPRPFHELIDGKPLDWQPQTRSKSQILLERAKKMILRREVWHLEFSCKNVRVMSVDVPQPNGRMSRQVIWYLVYKVENKGKHLRPVTQEDDWGHLTYGVEPFAGPKLNGQVPHFFPNFQLYAHDRKKSYTDRVIPAAQEAINIRERMGVRLLNSVEMCKVAIEPGKSVWGVATWEFVDPRVDFFSVYIKGLTNAFKYTDNYRPGTPPGTGRKYTYKTLEINFWRFGDSVAESEDDFQFGVPLYKDELEQAKYLKLYGLDQPLDFRWVYR